MVKQVGILYNGRMPAAKEMAYRLPRELPGNGVSFWVCPVGEEARIREQVPQSSLIISVGGDGTILRAARAVVPWAVPIVGINLGKLGFMAELSAQEAVDKLPGFLAGEARVEERAMLLVELPSRPGPEVPTFYALNDVVVGRGSVSRVIYVEVTVDGEPLTTYKADGVILATATGSTGYALAAGGPILYPQSRDILLQPVAPHLSLPHGIVLPPTAVVELVVRSDHQAMLSIDGQIDTPLHSQERLRVCLSPHSARFLRAQAPAYFYGTLPRRLRGQE